MLVSRGACQPRPMWFGGFLVAPVVGGGVTAQPASSRHVAWGDAISNSVFLTLLSRGCGFCGQASKGALFAPVSNHNVMEMGGGCPAPNTWREVGDFFHFLFYFWLLTQCLTCLLISKCSFLCDTQRKPSVHVCLYGRRPEGCLVAQAASTQGEGTDCPQHPQQSVCLLAGRMALGLIVAHSPFFPYVAWRLG